MATINKDKLERKLAILGKGIVPAAATDKPKNIDARKKFWSDMMVLAEKDGDKLKASELLGRSEADFSDTLRHAGYDGGAIQVQPMSIKGLKDAINSAKS